MAEIDVFERRVADTLLWYADDVAPTVDATAVAHRVALEHPRRRGALRRWRPAVVPRVAWIVLLVAALLSVLVGGMLIAGSQQGPKLPAVVPPIGQTFACPAGSTPDEPGPVDQARPLEERWAMGFDRRAGRVVAVTNAGDGFETWTFDVCANTWTQMHPSREPPSFDWARLVYDVDSDVTILVAYGASAHPWVYDLQANTWTEMGAAPTYAIPWAYDPLSGLVVAAAPPLLWNYDVETDRWTPIRQVNGEGCGPCTYDASVDRIVAPGDGLFDIRTGRWSKSDADAPHVLDWLTFPAITYDEAAKRTVVGGNVRLAAYDATADRWETVEFPDPDLWSGVSMVYDSVNERLLVLPDYWAEWTDGTLVGDVLALDLTTGEWTVLLELIDGQ